jgi:hypothetical protein
LSKRKLYCFEKTEAGGKIFKTLHRRSLSAETQLFFIPHVMLFVAPDGKFKLWYKISGAMKHNINTTEFFQYLPLFKTARRIILIGYPFFMP